MKPLVTAPVAVPVAVAVAVPVTTYWTRSEQLEPPAAAAAV